MLTLERHGACTLKHTFSLVFLFLSFSTVAVLLSRSLSDRSCSQEEATMQGGFPICLVTIESWPHTGTAEADNVNLSGPSGYIYIPGQGTCDYGFAFSMGLAQIF
jgi:hypothetical protein